MSKHGFARTLLSTCAGPIVWAVHFVWIYGFTGLVCARPAWDWQWIGMNANSLVLVASAVAALALIAWAGLHAWPQLRDREPGAFAAWTALGLAGLSAVAVVYETAAVWLVAGCV
jgi:hypothetical protein